MTTETEQRTHRPDAETPAVAIKRLLEADDRNLTWLAKKTGLSVGHLLRVTQGERAVSAALASKLAELFEVPTSTFIESAAE